MRDDPDYDQAMFERVAFHDHEGLADLISEYPLYKFSDRASELLHYAYDHNEYQIVRVMTKKGAGINFQDKTISRNQLRLWTAMMRSNMVKLRWRLLCGDNVNEAPQRGKFRNTTALWLAVAFGREDAARMLIKAGADVNLIGGHDQVPPLCVSLKSCDNNMTILLIDAGADVNAVDAGGRPLLHLALEKNKNEVALIMVKAGANVNATDKYGRSALHLVVNKGSVQVAQSLIEAQASINATDEKGTTALHLACENADKCMIDCLINAGADPRRANQAGLTPADVLVAVSDIYMAPASISKIFTLFTDYGATVNGKTANISPLVPSDVIRAIVPENTHFWLAANNDAPMLAAELANGLEPNMTTENGMTLMHWACAGDAPECVQLLLDAGADKEAGDPKPIFYCMHESSECLKHIIKSEVNVNHQILVDDRGNKKVLSAIYYALAANSPACVTALVGAGAWVTGGESSRIFQHSPLSIALHMCPVPLDALRALLAAAGERVLRERISCKPALYYAVECSTVDGVRFLIENGADVNQEKISVLEFAEDELSDSSPARAARLTAIIDYLKSLPCFSENK